MSEMFEFVLMRWGNRRMSFLSGFYCFERNAVCQPVFFFFCVCPVRSSFGLLWASLGPTTTTGFCSFFSALRVCSPRLKLD